MTKKSSLSQKCKTQKLPEESSDNKASSSSKEIPFDSGHAYLLNGNALQPLTQEEIAGNAEKYGLPLGYSWPF